MKLNAQIKRWVLFGITLFLVIVIDMPIISLMLNSFRMNQTELEDLSRRFSARAGVVPGDDRVDEEGDKLMTTQKISLPLAVQLYSLRTLPGSFDETLAQVAAAGFSAVETVGDYGCTAAEMLDLLNRHGLRVIATHLQLDALRDDLPGIIAFNQAIGNDTLVVPYIPHLIGEKWATVFQKTGRLLGELGRRCQAKGMRLLYHNHHWEMVELDGKLALDWLFDGAGESLAFEPDLAWITFAGLDPVALLQRYAGRCPRVHIKDLAPKSKRPQGEIMDGAVMADAGYGTLNWPRLLAAARDAGAAWYIVEHDNPQDPIASVSRSLAYLRQQLPGILQA